MMSRKCHKEPLPHQLSYGVKYPTLSHTSWRLAFVSLLVYRGLRNALTSFHYHELRSTVNLLLGTPQLHHFSGVDVIWTEFGKMHQLHFLIFTHFPPVCVCVPSLRGTCQLLLK